MLAKKQAIDAASKKNIINVIIIRSHFGLSHCRSSHNCRTVSRKPTTTLEAPGARMVHEHVLAPSR